MKKKKLSILCIRKHTNVFKVQSSSTSSTLLKDYIKIATTTQELRHYIHTPQAS
jgi:hypothetical protein